MSSIRRVSGIFIILLSMLFLARCAARNDAAITEVAPGGRDRNPCTSGSGSDNRQAPIVCVDDSNRTLSVSPDPVRAHNAMADNAASPVVVHWWTRSGRGDLQLEIAPGCLTVPECDGNGHCSARTTPRAKGTCKYDVWINGGNHDRLDPTIVVDDCCA